MIAIVSGRVLVESRVMLLPKAEDVGVETQRLVLDAELMRGRPEHWLKLPDQVRWREAQLARDVGDWTRRLRRFEEQVASHAQPPEPDVTEQHRQGSCRENLRRVKPPRTITMRLAPQSNPEMGRMTCCPPNCWLLVRRFPLSLAKLRRVGHVLLRPSGGWREAGIRA
jgi:hypothetical protein